MVCHKTCMELRLTVCSSYNGSSPSGKAQHFDCCIRWFESSWPSHVGMDCAPFKKPGLWPGFSRTPLCSMRNPLRAGEAFLPKRAE